MRKIGILGLVGLLAVALAGCGGGHHDPDIFVFQQLSDQPADGDIGFTAPSAYSFSQANISKNVFFGIDAGGTEFRAFLDFPLDGSTGGGVLPLNAAIVSADVEVYVNDVRFATSVPTLVDLVPFPIPGLTNADFNSSPLLTRDPFAIFRSDIGRLVRIDVTSLMVEAQRLGLRDLQLRFLLDLVPGASGLVELDDGVAGRSPFLTVEYR